MKIQLFYRQFLEWLKSVNFSLRFLSLLSYHKDLHKPRFLLMLYNFLLINLITSLFYFIYLFILLLLVNKFWYKEFDRDLYFFPNGYPHNLLSVTFWKLCRMILKFMWKDKWMVSGNIFYEGDVCSVKY